MIVTPDFDAFARAYQAGEAGVLRTTLVGDLLTPVAAYIKLRHGRQGAAFLLESVEGGAVRGRYSMIGLDPDLVWRCQDGVASLDRRALDHRNRFVLDERPPLESLRALIGESAQPLAEFTDVRELQRLLKAQGVPLQQEADESATGPASFIAVDPDGNPILVDQHV